MVAVFDSRGLLNSSPRRVRDKRRLAAIVTVETATSLQGCSMSSVPAASSFAHLLTPDIYSRVVEILTKKPAEGAHSLVAITSKQFCYKVCPQIEIHGGELFVRGRAANAAVSRTSARAVADGEAASTLPLVAPILRRIVHQSNVLQVLDDLRSSFTVGIGRKERARALTTRWVQFVRARVYVGGQTAGLHAESIKRNWSQLKRDVAVPTTLAGYTVRVKTGDVRQYLLATSNRLNIQFSMSRASTRFSGALTCVVTEYCCMRVGSKRAVTRAEDDAGADEPGAGARPPRSQERTLPCGCRWRLLVHTPLCDGVDSLIVFPSGDGGHTGHTPPLVTSTDLKDASLCEYFWHDYHDVALKAINKAVAAAFVEGPAVAAQLQTMLDTVRTTVYAEEIRVANVIIDSCATLALDKHYRAVPMSLAAERLDAPSSACGAALQWIPSTTHFGDLAGADMAAPSVVATATGIGRLSCRCTHSDLDGVPVYYCGDESRPRVTFEGARKFTGLPMTFGPGRWQIDAPTVMNMTAYLNNMEMKGRTQWGKFVDSCVQGGKEARGDDWFHQILRSPNGADTRERLYFSAMTASPQMRKQFWSLDGVSYTVVWDNTFGMCQLALQTGVISGVTKTGSGVPLAYHHHASLKQVSGTDTPTAAAAAAPRPSGVDDADLPNSVPQESMEGFFMATFAPVLGENVNGCPARAIVVLTDRSMCQINAITGVFKTWLKQYHTKWLVFATSSPPPPLSGSKKHLKEVRACVRAALDDCRNFGAKMSVCFSARASSAGSAAPPPHSPSHDLALRLLSVEVVGYLDGWTSTGGVHALDVVLDVLFDDVETLLVRGALEARKTYTYLAFCSQFQRRYAGIVADSDNALLPLVAEFANRSILLCSFHVLKVRRPLRVCCAALQVSYA